MQHSGVPLKVKRLARDPNRFIWAVSVAQSRCINMQMRVGALVQDANMLIPYAGKFLNLQLNAGCKIKLPFSLHVIVGFQIEFIDVSFVYTPDGLYVILLTFLFFMYLLEEAVAAGFYGECLTLFVCFFRPILARNLNYLELLMHMLSSHDSIEQKAYFVW